MDDDLYCTSSDPHEAPTVGWRRKKETAVSYSALKPNPSRQIVSSPLNTEVAFRPRVIQLARCPNCFRQRQPGIG
ncbi:hypothetical protein RRG08_064675 [Elysia crispata]|uniref:Uncharacterized protein n=1 Tax=Elysia crispata TaxID=231223 RepID=A0AAE1E8K3_9GAST|nr:hypothetical protein RRG08_064675 [Elysia crispata]